MTLIALAALFARVDAVSGILIFFMKPFSNPEGNGPNLMTNSSRTCVHRIIHFSPSLGYRKTNLRLVVQLDEVVENVSCSLLEFLLFEMLHVSAR